MGYMPKSWRRDYTGPLRGLVETTVRWMASYAEDRIIQASADISRGSGIPAELIEVRALDMLSKEILEARGRAAARANRAGCSRNVIAVVAEGDEATGSSVRYWPGWRQTSADGGTPLEP